MEFIKIGKEYLKGTLDREELDCNPFLQATQWFHEAVKERVADPYAMTLATASEQGKPSARTVLLRGMDETGFIFFTHYLSRKGKELDGMPYATLLFLWKELERQLIIEGSCEKIDPSLSDEYFAQRRRASQISAWASEQDAPILSRDVLEERYQLSELKYRDKKVPRPSYWGGYRVVPSRFEFWQGRQMRLHDRFEYVLEGSGWKINRLCP